MADIIHRLKAYFHNTQQQRVRDKIKMYIFIRTYPPIKKKNINNKIWQDIYLNYQHVCIGNAYWKRSISFIGTGFGLKSSWRCQNLHPLCCFWNARTHKHTHTFETAICFLHKSQTRKNAKIKKTYEKSQFL